MERRALEHLGALNRSPERLTVGCVHAFYDCFPEAVRRLRKAFPSSPVRLFLKHSYEVIERVLNGDFDMGYTHHPCSREGYACSLLYRDALLLVTRSANRQSPRGVRLENLPDLPILYSGFLDTHMLKKLFGRVPRFELDIDVGSKIIPYLHDEDKYTVLPQRMIREQLDSGAFRPIPLLDFELPPLEYFLLCPLRHPYARAIQMSSRRAFREFR